MSAVPVPKPAPEPAPETVEQRFRRLEAAWKSDTQFLSDAHRIIAHPAFEEIISMGDVVVPLMLRDLEKGPHKWVWALPRITGQNPVSPSDAGNIRKMGEAWVHWGLENGYRW